MNAYIHHLEQLTALLGGMGERVLKLVHLATAAFDAVPQSAEATARAAEDAKVMDREINQLSQDLEEESTRFLAQHSPLAADLRFVTSALKISGYLERIGDHAKNTIKRRNKLQSPPPEEVARLFRTMGGMVEAMLSDALLAVTGREKSRAMEVWRRDDEVDAQYHQLLSLLQGDLLTQPGGAVDGTHLLFAAKNFERIADHATDLAKTVPYVTSGTPPIKADLKAHGAANGNAT